HIHTIRGSSLARRGRAERAAKPAAIRPAILHAGDRLLDPRLRQLGCPYAISLQAGDHHFITRHCQHRRDENEHQDDEQQHGDQRGATFAESREPPRSLRELGAERGNAGTRHQAETWQFVSTLSHPHPHLTHRHAFSRILALRRGQLRVSDWPGRRISCAGRVRPCTTSVPFAFKVTATTPPVTETSKL